MKCPCRTCIVRSICDKKCHIVKIYKKKMKIITAVITGTGTLIPVLFAFLSMDFDGRITTEEGVKVFSMLILMSLFEISLLYRTDIVKKYMMKGCPE